MLESLRKLRTDHVDFVILFREWEDKTIYESAEHELDEETHFSLLKAQSGT